MFNWAVIKDNVVINTVYADSKEVAEDATGFTCIEYTLENPVGVGYTWDGEAFAAPITE